MTSHLIQISQLFRAIVDIQATIECRFALKRVRVMIITIKERNYFLENVENLTLCSIPKNLKKNPACET